MSDIRYAFRSLIRARWFTVAAVLTFAVGIGVNLAVFSVVDRMLFRRLPYGAVDELVLLRACGPDGECAGAFPSVIAYEGRQRLTTIDGIGVAAMPATYRVSPDEPALILSGVSANLLHVLRVQPVAGRDFSDEDAALKRRVAILSHDTWQRRFNGSLDLLGKPIGAAANGNPVTIVGVLPADFIPPTWTAVNPKWDGLVLDTTGWAAIEPEGGIAVPVARLSAGASVRAAQAEVDALAAALAPALRGRDGRVPVIRVDPIQRALFSRFRPDAWLVLSASFVLLLLACANLANLLLARGRSREHAAAIHAALGATRGTLIRTAALESLIVCAAGTAVAMAVMAAASKALLAVVPPLFARYATGALDARVVALAVAAAAACAVAAAIAPALRVSRVDLLAVLQRASGSAQRARLRGGRSLLVVEAALGVLLVLSGLLVLASFRNLAGEDLGFRPDGLYIVGVRREPPAQPSAASALAAYEQLLDALRDVPGVQSAAGADSPVASGYAPMRGISKDRSVRGGRYQITAGYFDTLRTRFLAGRAFTDAEVRTRAAVAILTLSAARHFFPDIQPSDSIGRPLVIDNEPPLSIVGVVPDLRQRHGESGAPALFVPLGYEASQYPAAVVRMQDGVALSSGLLRRRLSERLGAGTVSLSAVSAGLDAGLHDPRFRAMLFSVLALSALMLAAVGLYAVASFDVATRRYEMGVRLSLGARATDILRLVLFDACRPVILGIGFGTVGAYWAEKFLRTFLYGIDARDPLTYVAAVGILLATSLVAAWVPARRAVRVDPAVVLRAQ